MSTKFNKAEVRYTAHGTEAEHCKKCEHFEAPAGCEVVAGRISPQGWCDQWEKDDGKGR